VSNNAKSSLDFLSQWPLKRCGFKLEQRIGNLRRTGSADDWPKYKFGHFGRISPILKERGVKGVKFGFNLVFEVLWFQNRVAYLKPKMNFWPMSSANSVQFAPRILHEN